MESLGWLGPDVWFAHAVHLDDASIATLAATGTAVAHCPSSNARLGAGIARVRDLRDAGVPVGLGVDGAASNEHASLWEEVRHAVLFARARGGPQALSVRDAVDLATMGGARVLGRADDLGSLEVGKQADLAVWDLSTLAHVDVADPVAALVLGGPPPLRLLLVRGEAVVSGGSLTTSIRTRSPPRWPPPAGPAASRGVRLVRPLPSSSPRERCPFPLREGPGPGTRTARGARVPVVP